MGGHRRTNQSSSGNESSFRLRIVQISVLLLAGMIGLRLFVLQVLDASFYQALASNQYEFYEELIPERGNIYVHDLKDQGIYPVATNLNLGFVYADPRNVIDAHSETEILGEILEMSNEEMDVLEVVLEKVTDPYEPIRHRVSSEALARIDIAKKEKKLAGISYIREPVRSYPEEEMGGHVLGFVGTNEDGSLSGKYGIEGYFNEELSGVAGHLASEQDAAGRFIAVADRSYQPAVDGADLVLTIDRNIQYTACSLLHRAVLQHSADGGSVVILDPSSGAVLAMCGAPDFDPNSYNKVSDIGVFNNPAIFNSYEPGSILKALTMAAALDAEAVTPSTTFEDFGFVDDVGCETPIRNADDKLYGVQTMTQVLEESINTGVIFAMQTMGRDVFANYLKNFGLGAYTGIELSKEVPGDISSLDCSSDCYAATAAFGQGITATPLQMVAAFAALSNGGHLFQPYVVDTVSYSDEREQVTKPIEVRQAISEKSSNLISAMLISVVENGHGKKAAVPGYYIAGKTGTAQVAGSGGAYSASNTIGSFAGYGPVGNPRFAMIVRIDHPRDVIYAESTAAPLFGEIAEFLLRYFEVPPQR